MPPWLLGLCAAMGADGAEPLGLDAQRGVEAIEERMRAHAADSSSITWRSRKVCAQLPERLVRDARRRLRDPLGEGQRGAFGRRQRGTGRPVFDRIELFLRMPSPSA